MMMVDDEYPLKKEKDNNDDNYVGVDDDYIDGVLDDDDFVIKDTCVDVYEFIVETVINLMRTV